MFLLFVAEQVTLHMLTSFLFLNESGFEAKLSLKALVIMWVTVIGEIFLFKDYWKTLL